MAFAKGNGAFVVAELCEKVCKEGGDAERAMMRSWFSDDIRAQIEQGDAKGKNVLLEKLNALFGSH